MPLCWIKRENRGRSGRIAPARQEDVFMDHSRFEIQADKRKVTLNHLKEQLYSLNMRMLLAIQNHDEAAQEDIRRQMGAVQVEIGKMGPGGKHWR